MRDLQTQSDPIKERSNDYENAPAAFDELKHTIQFAFNTVTEYRKGKYEHLTETEFINISEAAEKAQKWYDAMRNKFMQSSRTSDSPVKLNEVRHEIQLLSSCVNSIINRPKPKPPTPAAGKTSSGGADQQQHQNGESDKKESGTSDTKTSSSNITDDSTMDVEF